MKNGVFLFSLDTELALGHFRKFDQRRFSFDGSRERTAVSRLIKLFEKYQIAATWAVVGHMFSDKFAGQYPDDWESRYPTFECMYKADHPLMHGADVVEAIKNSSVPYEIGFHGFTHKKFSEDLMAREVAKTEIEAWKKTASDKGISGRSVVFPNNRIGHLGLFKSKGFTCYRGEELTVPFFKSSSIIGRLARRLYYYLVEFSEPLVYDAELDAASGLVNLPSSRWMFGLNRHLAFLLDSLGLHTFRMRAIAKAVARAAQEKKIIHIWAHPYEFRREQDFERLEYLLECVKREIDNDRMISLSMSKLASQFLASATVN